MIEIKEKQRCSGCAACANACPVGCIKMVEDSEGFLYPQVEMDRCIHCEKCNRICPILSPSTEREGTPTCFGGYNRDFIIRKNSSSGGIFTAIAETIIEQNGIVYAAAMSDDGKVLNHIAVSRKEDIEALRGSKYLQSHIGNTYNEIKKNLELGRQVAFVGTPCQVEGIKSYLGKEYQNLLCIDFICHGVPSPKLWRKYVEMLEKRFKASAGKVFFRHKQYGWRNFSLLIEFTNNKEYRKIFKKDLFGQSFLQNVCLRPSCHACAFKKINRLSDLTLGDFWGNRRYIPDDDMGISLLLAHTDKGVKMIDQIREKCEIIEVPYENAVRGNTPLYSSVARNENRDRLFRDIDNVPVEKLLRENVNTHIPLKMQIWYLLKKLHLK